MWKESDNFSNLPAAPEGTIECAVSWQKQAAVEPTVGQKIWFVDVKGVFWCANASQVESGRKR